MSLRIFYYQRKSSNACDIIEEFIVQHFFLSRVLNQIFFFYVCVCKKLATFMVIVEIFNIEFEFGPFSHICLRVKRICLSHMRGRRLKADFALFLSEALLGVIRLSRFSFLSPKLFMSRRPMESLKFLKTVIFLLPIKVH